MQKHRLLLNYKTVVGQPKMIGPFERWALNGY
jgi:hypothetical protein